VPIDKWQDGITLNLLKNISKELIII